MPEDVVIAINPGSTSTKVAVLTRDRLIGEANLEHVSESLKRFATLNQQTEWRESLVREASDSFLAPGFAVAAIVGRGGPLRPLRSGTYRVTEAMLKDLRDCRYSEHPSNLGAIIADRLGNAMRVPAFVVDPITVDDLIPEARVSGVPGIERKSRYHALNIRAICRKAAALIGKPFERTNFVAAHLGGGFSIVALRHGKAIDVNNGLLGQGPFSPNRAGSLPIGDVIELCFSGTKTKSDIIRLFSKESGFQGYLGTADTREVLRRIDQGDAAAARILDAQIYQVAKEIGSMAVALASPVVDGIVLTGGIARSDRIVGEIRRYVEFLGPVLVFPGEAEMEALAMGAFRVLDGLEPALRYEDIA